MIAGTAHHVPQHALVQDVPEHRRVLASQDRLPFQPGSDGTVDRRAAVPRLARADDRVWQRVARGNDLPSRDVR